MKKFIITLLALTIPSGAFASVQMKVTAMEEFNTENPSEQIKVKVVKDTQLGNYNLKSGDIMESQILKVTDPKRGKRNAVFYVKPLNYYDNNQKINITDEFYGKYSKRILSKEELKKIPPGRVIKKAALGVGSYFVKGLSTGVDFAEGVVKNEEDNRLKSGVVNVYKESPLSFISKGEELDIKTGDEFYFVFKISDNSDSEDTYEEDI